MLSGIISIIANAIYMFVLNLQIYTDRAMMYNGQYREWKRSPVGRLHVADKDWLYVVQIILSAVSVLSGILVLIGVKNDIVRRVQIISLIAATLMFVIIMIVSANIHAEYA